MIHIYPILGVYVWFCDTYIQVRYNVMETVKRQTESFLFQNSEGQFRAIPFYELSIDEWVVYEKGNPKYLIDFNRRQMPLVQDIKTKLENGEDLEETVWKLGRFLGKDWTTKHNISGTEIPNSQKIEQIELVLLDNLSELFIDLTFVATENIDFDILLNDLNLFNTFSTDTELLLETSFIDNYENLVRMLTFLFKTKVSLSKLTSNNEKEIYDLSAYKENCLTENELSDNHQVWLDIVDRENTMDEFGHPLGIISYINRNKDKKHLILITEKRKQWK